MAGGGMYPSPEKDPDNTSKNPARPVGGGDAAGGDAAGGNTGIKFGENEAGQYWDEYGNTAATQLQDQYAQAQQVNMDLTRGSVDAGNAYGGALAGVGNAAAANAGAWGDAVNTAGNALGGALQDSGYAALGAGLDQTAQLQAGGNNALASGAGGANAVQMAGNSAVGYGLGQGSAITGTGSSALGYGLGQAGQAGATSQDLKSAAAGALTAGQGAMGRDVSGVQQQALMGLEGTEGPSAAQAQLQSATNRNMANSLAMSRSGRGFGGNASMARQAAGQQAAVGQDAALQSAQLRAQETAAWRQRQAANLGTSGQLATGQAQANAQREASLSSLGMQGLQGAASTQLSAAQLGQAAYNQQLSAQQAAAQVGQNAYAQQIGANESSAQLMQGAYGQQLAAQQAAAQNQQGAYAQQLAALQGAATTEIGAKEAAGQLSQAGLAQQSASYGQAAQAEMGGLGQAAGIYGQGSQYGLANLSQQGQVETTGLGYEEQHDQDRLNAYAIEAGIAPMQTQQQNTMVGAGMSAAGIGLGALALLSDRNEKENIKPTNGTLVLPDPGAKASQQAANAASGAARGAAMAPKVNPYTSLAQGFGGLGGQMMGADPGRFLPPSMPYAMSDEREKESLKAIEGAPGYTFNYKDPDAMGATDGKQFGIMAQDLEKTPAGRSVVKDVGGRKMVDTSRLTMVNTAAMNALTDRLSKIEARIGGGKAA